jgi:amidase
MSPAALSGEDLAFAGMARQAELVQAGKVSPRELVSLYLARIERMDPKLDAFRVVTAERAQAEAAEAERRRAAGEGGPLNGVPIAVKDCHDLAGEVTTNGTNCFDEPAAADCEMVSRLRAAGAIVIGKTNLPELATSAFTETDTFGITRNPWNTERTPNGSSGGSAVAVAAGLAACATASDGAGSIRGPAAYCNLVGLKPQRGRISMAPDREHWLGMSVAGCVSRTVEDTALWLDVTAGPVEGDVDRPPPPERPYVEAAKSPPGKLRVAASTKPIRPLGPPIVSDEAKGAVEEAARVLGSLGHAVDWQDPDYGQVGTSATPLYMAGIAQDFAKLPHPERAMSYTKGLARLGRLYPGFVVRRAKAAREKWAARINRIFDDHDVLVTCVAGLPPYEVGRWAGKAALPTVLGMSRVHCFNIVWNYVGNPAMSVPMGFTADGLPLAVQIVGRPNDEAALLSLAVQLEAERGWPAERPPIS